MRNSPITGSYHNIKPGFTMTVIDKLATSLGRRDEVPNQELARQIAAAGDKKAVKELVEHLGGKDKDIRSDCIKTLYEIGALKPALIAPHAAAFVQLLDNKDNRMQWGAMTALNSMTGEVPATVYAALGKLAAVAEKGSVITRDNYMAILTRLCAEKKYYSDVLALLNEQLKACPANQLPMYAENLLQAVQEADKPLIMKTLTARLGDFEKESKRKRVEKVIKKLQGR